MKVSLLSGAVAADLSGFSSLAQAFHVVRARSTAGLSDVSWLLLGLSAAAWLTWGLLSYDPYLICSNTPSLAVAALKRIHDDSSIPPQRVAATAAAVGAAFSLQLHGGTAGADISVVALLP